jgi:hypothetical protein
MFVVCLFFLSFEREPQKFRHPARKKTFGRSGASYWTPYLCNGHYTDALVQHPLSPYREKCGAMGCGILYRMVAEWIGLCAMLATRRTGVM